MERLPELQLVVLRHWSSHPPPQLGLWNRQSIGYLALGVETQLAHPRTCKCTGSVGRPRIYALSETVAPVSVLELGPWPIP